MNRAILILLLTAAVATAETPDRRNWKRAWQIAARQSTANPLDGYPQQANIVAYYPFNSDANDYSGNGNNAAIASGAPVLTNGVNGNAYYFDGTDDMIATDSSTILNGPQKVTISAWVKVYAWSNKGVLTMRGSTFHGFYLSATSGTFQWFVKNTSRLAAGYSVDTWYNLVGVFDGSLDSANRSAFYVNGSFIGYQEVTAYDTFTVDDFWKFGMDEFSSRFSNVAIDEAAFWNTALSSNEVYQVYTRDAP